MKEYAEFTEFYNVCTSIIKNNIQYLHNLSNTEKIKFIRENIDKNILNCYHIAGNITQKVANEINSETTFLKLSVDNMIKNLLEHPEITIDEYRNISLYIINAEYILKKNNKNLIYFKIDNKIY